MKVFRIIEVDKHFTAYKEADITPQNRDELMSDNGRCGHYSINYAVKLSFRQILRGLLGKRIHFHLTSHKPGLLGTSDDDPFLIEHIS